MNEGLKKFFAGYVIGAVAALLLVLAIIMQF